MSPSVLAHPPWPISFRRRFTATKLVFISAGAVALTLIAGLSFSTWSFLRERKALAGEASQRRAAEEQRKNAQAAQAREAEQRTTAEHLLYVANMNNIQGAWEQNNVGLVRELLEQTQNSPERGLEWYYWQRLAHLEQRTFRGHVADVILVAVSPDGRRVVSGSEDHTAKVWSWQPVEKY